MSIYLTGDTHGETYGLASRLEELNLTANDYVIICGDFGSEYGGQVFSGIKKTCKKFPCTFIVVRGNHDTRYWRDHEGQEGWHLVYDDHFLVQNKYPNLWYVKDEGDIVNLDGKNFIFIPGAWSIDGKYRLMNHYIYEPDEQLTPTEFVLLLGEIKEYGLDKEYYVVAHTYPIKIEDLISDLFMAGYTGPVDKSMERRIQVILNNINFKKYFFGHLHDNRLIDDKYQMLYDDVVKLED